MVMNKYSIGKFQFFIAKVLKRIPLPRKFKIFYNTTRHKIIEKKLLPFFEKAESKISYNDTISENNGPIWLFWWQGEQSMPPIVKCCIKAIKSNSCGRKVNLVTQYNINSYLELSDISDRIMYLKNKENITLTFFSDIVRFKLLEKYGGLWLDATILVTDDIDNKYFSDIFTCSGYSDEDYFFVTEGDWCSFLIGGSANNPLFQFMCAFYEAYWEKNDGLVDYFIIDYALKYAWSKNIGGFKDFTIKHKNKINPNLFSLAPLLNNEFDISIWNKLNKNTNMFKLTYKKKFIKNRRTFYKFIIGRNS